MAKSGFIRLFIFFCCLLYAGVPLGAQVFWSESFSDQIAASTNWINGGVNAGPSDWLWSNDPNAGFQDPALPAFNAPSTSNGYFYFDSNNNGLPTHDVTLTGQGRIADCTGKSDVHLRFYSQYVFFNPDGTVAELGVSTDGVNFTYKPLFAGLPPNLVYHDWVDVDLDEADNQAQVWLQFRWIGAYEYHWKIDDLELYTSCQQNPAAIFCDDFETYNTAQPLGPQSGHWTTWSGNEGGNEDGIVSTEQASTFPNALKVWSASTAGGPEDVVLDLGNRNSGRYQLNWKMFIPSGKQGYYNIQNAVPVGAGDWNLHLRFGANNTGDVRLTFNGAVLRSFIYPHDQWFELVHLVDLDNNLLTVYIDGKFVLKRSYTKNLGGINFYGANELNLFYIVDVSFVALPPLVYNADACATAVDISQYLGQAVNVPQTTGLFDNSTATVSTSDPAVDCWDEVGNGGTDFLNNTLWFSLTGDGNIYDIQTVPCNATNYVGTNQGNIGDTQMAVYAGNDCSSLTLLECNDDFFPFGQPDFRAGVTLETQPGQSYFMLIDGFETQGVPASGEFCIQITQ